MRSTECPSSLYTVTVHGVNGLSLLLQVFRFSWHKTALRLIVSSTVRHSCQLARAPDTATIMQLIGRILSAEAGGDARSKTAGVDTVKELQAPRVGLGHGCASLLPIKVSKIFASKRCLSVHSDMLYLWFECLTTQFENL